MRIVEAAKNTRKPIAYTLAITGLIGFGVSIGYTLPRRPDGPHRKAEGTIACESGAPVVGAWVEARQSKSGWASLHRLGSVGLARFERDLPGGGEYSIHVGCGGSGREWQTTNLSTYVGSNNPVDFICDDRPARPSTVSCVVRE